MSFLAYPQKFRTTATKTEEKTMFLNFLGIKHSTSALVQTKKSFIGKFSNKVLAFFSFFSFLAHKKLIKHILTSIWNRQHWKAGQNMQSAVKAIFIIWSGRTNLRRFRVMHLSDPISIIYFWLQIFFDKKFCR